MMNMASITIQHLLSECKIHGSGNAQVVLEDSELYVLFCIGLCDLGWDFNAIGIEDIERPDNDYFKIPIKWFNGLHLPHVTPRVLLDMLAKTHAINEDFGLYIKNLCALHRRRGNEAWGHINEKSGKILSVFVEKYIRPPIESSAAIHQNIPPDLYLQWRDHSVRIKSSSGEYLIKRINRIQ